jgi:hypothetical protein
MKLVRKVTVVAAIVIWVSIILAAQQPADLVGTWSGDATLEGMDEPDTLTLVLEMKEGKLAGHMTDQYEAVNGDIADIVLEQGAFNFTAPVLFGQGSPGTIHFKMKVDGDTMKGEIEIPEMSAKGAWQATKQK